MRVVPQSEKQRFASRFAEARSAKGLTNAQLGEAIGVSERAVSSWATGAAWPRLDHAAHAARVLEVSLAWLVGAERREGLSPRQGELVRLASQAVAEAHVALARLGDDDERDSARRTA